MPLLILFVLALISLVFHLLDLYLAKPRVISEFALDAKSWDDIRRFWESVGRLP